MHPPRKFKQRMHNSCIAKIIKTKGCKKMHPPLKFKQRMHNSCIPKIIKTKGCKKMHPLLKFKQRMHNSCIPLIIKTKGFKKMHPFFIHHPHPPTHLVPIPHTPPTKQQTHSHQHSTYITHHKMCVVFE